MSDIQKLKELIASRPALQKNKNKKVKSFSDRKNKIPDGDRNLHKGMQNTGNGNCIRKYVSVFLLLKLCKAQPTV